MTLPALAGGKNWRVDYNPMNVTLVDLPVYEADFDEDGDVDGADLASWTAGFGTSGSATHMQGDADGDLDVDGADFLTWQRQLGSGSAATTNLSTSAVPEPSAILLAAAAVLARLPMCRRRRHVSGPRDGAI